MIVLIKGNGPKRLLGTRQRAQHFCRPEHRSSVTEEHQTSSGVRIHRLRQTEQSASYRNNLQIACHAAPILESKNSRSGDCTMCSCNPSGREDLGEAGHAKASMLRNQEQQEITEVLDHSKACPNSECCGLRASGTSRDCARFHGQYLVRHWRHHDYRASRGRGPFHDFYTGLLAKGMKAEMARLTLAAGFAGRCNFSRSRILAVSQSSHNKA